MTQQASEPWRTTVIVLEGDAQAAALLMLQAKRTWEARQPEIIALETQVSGLMAMVTERGVERDRLRAQVARLREALPDADRLETLATWFDVAYSPTVKFRQGDEHHDEVQRALRRWATQARAVLAETQEAKP